MPTLTEAEKALLRSILARLIPEEKNFPGAIGAGAENFLYALWEKDAAAELPLMLRGIDQVAVEAAARFPGQKFPELAPLQQDELLRDLECGQAREGGRETAQFFSQLVEWTHEGFYADPANGGNRDGLSWRAIGYDPRPPLPDLAGSPRFASGPDADAPRAESPE